jgi:hypothetical protein
VLIEIPENDDPGGFLGAHDARSPIMFYDG